MRPVPLGPFRRYEGNPVLRPRDDSTFRCPVSGLEVAWEAKDVFNPAAVVREGRVHLIYRAEDRVGRYSGTSRLGLALSDDGLHFETRPEPVLYPDHDEFLGYEREGGCEDPRVVEMEDGTYHLTYTAYDGRTARLMVATSPDLVTWTKHGPAFTGTPLADRWTKSGAVFTRLEGDRLVATRLEGLYWMLFGESEIFLAHSKDGLRWTPVDRDEMETRWHEHDGPERVTREERTARRAVPILRPRRGDRFDGDLVEPGPPPLVTDDGVLVIYNAKALGTGVYSAGHAVLDREDPTAVISRDTSPFFSPESAFETAGQVPSVTFLEGLVRHRSRWMLYYGTADSMIAVALSATHGPEIIPEEGS